MEDKLENMPLIDLHIHIDGAFDISKTYEIIKRDNIEVGEKIDSIDDLKKLMTVSENCNSLGEFLQKFGVQNILLQTKEHIEEIVEDLVVRLANQKIIYAELRFAPLLCMEQGLLMEEVVEAALNGMNKGMKKVDSIKTKLILCMMRNASKDLNMDTITIASKYLDKGVGGIDLAGDEAAYKTKEFSKLFEYAKERKVPFTIHAGEADGSESIKAAIDFGTARIGHGIKSIEDKKIYDEIKEKNILLEVCPISNLKTGEIKDIKNHPIKKFIDDELNICIASDDPGIQCSCLRDDYKLLQKEFNITYEQMIKLNINAVKCSFMNGEDKPKYIKLLQLYLQ